MFGSDSSLDLVEGDGNEIVTKGLGQASSVLMPMANWPPVGAIHVETSNYVAPLQFQRPGVQVSISLDILILRSIGQLIRKAEKFNIHSQKILRRNPTRRQYGIDLDTLFPQVVMKWKAFQLKSRLSGISRKLDASDQTHGNMGKVMERLAQKSASYFFVDVPGPNKRVDEVFPRDLGGRMENLLEVQKETDIPEHLQTDNRFKKQTKILDSEDSEEEKAISSSRRLISRRRLIDFAYSFDF
ncbi:hypothetical protein Tco_0173014 [Tanacetum coccineum]